MEKFLNSINFKDENVEQKEKETLTEADQELFNRKSEPISKKSDIEDNSVDIKSKVWDYTHAVGDQIGDAKHPIPIDDRYSLTTGMANALETAADRLTGGSRGGELGDGSRSSNLPSTRDDEKSLSQEPERTTVSTGDPTKPIVTVPGNPKLDKKHSITTGLVNALESIKTKIVGEESKSQLPDASNSSFWSSEKNQTTTLKDDQLHTTHSGADEDLLERIEQLTSE